MTDHECWHKSVEIIEAALIEWFGSSAKPRDGQPGYAEAILARLAHHEPPILTEFVDLNRESP